MLTPEIDGMGPWNREPEDAVPISSGSCAFATSRVAAVVFPGTVGVTVTCKVVAACKVEANSSQIN